MAKSVTAEEETRTRARTRRAILEAAVRVFGDNPKAPLSEVAETAGVARSTLQRYFPERADLTCALGDYADELIREATERARTTEGTALEAFSRLAAEYFALQRVVMLAFGNEDHTEPPSEEECGPADLAVFDLVERGHEEGTIDPRITPLWAQQLLWAGLYAGWSYVAVARVPAYEALNMCLLSLVKAVSREQSG
ncbi:TetR/AcrR family transcriptional regulator [Nocardiopsis sp. NRRL B-16309]|uniref:TetR/AcrR family transcriptional regulator n=1 Tax=Nocardiopsis sp. NRRL B-16309 TaxID=1519494 RepID=UPI0006B04B28|nr:TetR/AcrR family transcriptional regulator [Nocardiopsis sp. NRRL B-16309]KOX15203.1 TetR family transcriptional regulator [Nocardiopsis sp. NRRL B-16309]